MHLLSTTDTLRSKTDIVLLSCPLQAYRSTRNIATDDNVANVQISTLMNVDKVQEGCGEDEKGVT